MATFHLIHCLVILLCLVLFRRFFGLMIAGFIEACAVPSFLFMPLAFAKDMSRTSLLPSGQSLVFEGHCSLGRMGRRQQHARSNPSARGHPCIPRQRLGFRHEPGHRALIASWRSARLRTLLQTFVLSVTIVNPRTMETRITLLVRLVRHRLRNHSG